MAGYGKCDLSSIILGVKKFAARSRP